MLKAASRSDVILFGEYHNNPICHWFELELAKGLKETDSNLLLGAEMFETDNQVTLNDYLAGKIDAEGLDSLARLWSNYDTDYAPLVDFAKDNRIKVIATNIPRRYASLVFKEGGFAALDDLQQDDLNWIVPLPIAFDSTLTQYAEMLTMMEGHGHGIDIVKAQAIKDATMAHSILANYSEGDCFLHYNGTYHSDYYQGILWYLQQENSSLDYLTISTVEQSDVSRLEDEHKGKADFILCVDEEMTKTY